MDHFELADKLEKEKNLTDDEFAGILLCEEPEFGEYLAEKALISSGELKWTSDDDGFISHVLRQMHRGNLYEPSSS